MLPLYTESFIKAAVNVQILVKMTKTHNENHYIMTIIVAQNTVFEKCCTKYTIIRENYHRM